MLKFIEGFDSYGPGGFLDIWTKADGNNVAGIAGGRFGTGQSMYTGGTWTKFLDAATNKITVGFAVYTPGDGGPILTFWNGPNLIATIRYYNITSLVYIQDASSNVYSCTKSIPAQTWCYLEVSVQDFGSSNAGNILIRLDGELIFSSPMGVNVNTGGVANGVATGITLYGNGGDNLFYDDLYINDGQGTYNTSFLEDGQVITLFPNGAGANTDLTPNGAGTNWGCLIDQPNDGDTTYVSGSTLGQYDLYTIPTIPTGQTLYIPAVVVNLVARRDNSSVKSCAAVIKSGPTLDVSNPINLNPSYYTYQGVFETDPNTSAPWTVAAINSLQFGAEVGS